MIEAMIAVYVLIFVHLRRMTYSATSIALLLASLAAILPVNAKMQPSTMTSSTLTLLPPGAPLFPSRFLACSD
jgi:hypothetical protein